MDFTDAALALASLNASNVGSGTLDNARLPSTISVASVTTTGNLTTTGSGVHVGDGSGLTHLNASSIATGTLDTSRLPLNITVTGNVAAARFIGDGSLLTGISTSGEGGGSQGPAPGPYAAFTSALDGSFLAWLQNVTTTMRGSWWGRAETPWVASVESDFPLGGLAYNSSIVIPDGRVVLSPSSATTVGIFDPSSNTLTEIEGAPGNDAYYGAILLPDGRVFLPGHRSNAHSPAIFNPTDGTLVDITITFPTKYDDIISQNYTELYYIGAAQLLPSGGVLVVLAPYAPSLWGRIVYIYDVETDSVTFPDLPFVTDIYTDVNVFNGASLLLPDGRLLTASYWESETAEFYFTDLTSNTITRLPVPDRLYLDISSMVLLPNGKVFCLPYEFLYPVSIGEFVPVYNAILLDPSTNTFSEVPLKIDGQLISYQSDHVNQWFGTFLLPDGRVLLYGHRFFWDSSENNRKLLEIFDPETGSWASPELAGSGLILDGNVLVDGRIFLLADGCRIMGSFPRPPVEFCLHPCFNKGHRYLSPR